MGREKATSQPTLQQITNQLQQLTDSLQWYADATKRCVCGYMTDNSLDLNLHREGCQILRLALIGDIIRVANELDKTPTYEEYAAMKSHALPSWTVITATVFDTWRDMIAEARLPRCQNKRKRVGAASLPRI